MQTSIYARSLVFIFLFLNLTLFAQSLEKISKDDTLYISFKKTYNMQIKGSFKVAENCINRSYVYKLIDSTKTGVNLTFFSDCKKKENLKKNIKYLKKKKKILINYYFYLKNEKQLLKELYTRRPTYIIDQDEIKNNEIVLREVNFLQIYNQFPIE